MNKVFAILQIVLAAVLLFIAGATLVNMLLIAFRPETISVVNVFVGQIIIIASFAALSRILFKKGLVRIRQLNETNSADDYRDRQAGS